MLNSPTLCQEFVHRALNPIRSQFPTVLIYQYIDDILLATPDEVLQSQVFQALQQQLTQYNLHISSKKYKLNFLFNI